jgi:serine/threonine-protein kinase
VILHELISGRRLFSRNTDVEIVHAVLEADIPRPSEVSRGVEIPRSLENVCMRALARNPDERFQTAAGFRAALHAAMRDLSPSLDLRDRVAELATAHAAEREDRKPPPPPQTATLPEVPWVMRNPLVASESDLEVEIDVLDAQRARSRAPRTTHIRLPLVSSRPWAAIGLALVLALASFGVLFAIPSRPGLPTVAPVSAEADVPIELRFESSPVGAEVRVGERVVGHTPTFLEVPRGTEALPVHVSLAGYADVDHTVVPDRPRTLRVYLHSLE